MWSRLRIAASVLAVATLAATGCQQGDPTTAAPPPTGPAPAPAEPTDGTRIVASGLRIPWGVAFLPDGTALVTERGTARVLSVTPAGAVTEVLRLPIWPTPDGGMGVRVSGEGGLLGIAVSPTYAADRWVYLYYTSYASTPAIQTDNRVVRFHLGGGAVEPVLTGIPAGDYHNGGRIAFGPDGMLYVATGETYATPAIAQDRTSLGGKILRITPDGEPAPGNPFHNSPVWTLGHRNVQGLAWDATGRMYASEFGDERFDELNLIEPGRNYGWPVVEGPGTGSRYTNPIATWSPTSEASPSGIAIVGDHVYVGCLAGKRLDRVGLDGKGLQKMLVGRYGRIRSVTRSPDGSLWLTTSNRDQAGTPVSDDDDLIIAFVP
jgi:glucose/arabinose dehydrogenase